MPMGRGSMTGDDTAGGRRGAPRVVYEPAFKPRLLTGTDPGPAEALDASAVPMKHEGSIPDRPSLFEYLRERRSVAKREDSRIPALGLGGIEPHDLSFPVDLVPGETERLGLSPTSHTQELNDRSDVRRQLEQQGGKVAVLEKV